MQPPRRDGTLVMLTYSPLSPPPPPTPPPLRTYLTSTACDIISFTGQGQFCRLICAA